MATQRALHGKPTKTAMLEAGEYSSPAEYEEQGDTRIIRDLMFGYLVEVTDAAGNKVLEPREAMRDEEVTIDQIGLIGLEQGESNHSFYTDDELARIQDQGRASEPVTADTDITDLGEFELSEWLETTNPDTGRVWTINEVLEEVGDDKDLAHRMLQAENIRSDGDPRTGLEKGLQAVIAE